VPRSDLGYTDPTLNKGTKIALIVLAVLTLVCLAGLWSVYTNASTALVQARTDAVKAGDEILILLAGGWDVKAVELRTTSEFKLESSDLARWREQFGYLVVGEMKLTGFELDPELLTATLASTAEFDKGKGDVTMTLTRQPRNSWMLAKFDVKPAE
jgi:hypothetical protein